MAVVSGEHTGIFFWPNSHLKLHLIREYRVMMAPTLLSPSTYLCLQLSLISRCNTDSHCLALFTNDPRSHLITLRPACSEIRPTPGFGFIIKLKPEAPTVAAAGASGSAATSFFVCVCESWSHVLPPRPLSRCWFTWWAELLRVYLHRDMYSNWVAVSRSVD